MGGLWRIVWDSAQVQAPVGYTLRCGGSFRSSLPDSARVDCQAWRIERIRKKTEQYWYSRCTVTSFLSSVPGSFPAVRWDLDLAKLSLAFQTWI